MPPSPPPDIRTSLRQNSTQTPIFTFIPIGFEFVSACPMEVGKQSSHHHFPHSMQQRSSMQCMHRTNKLPPGSCEEFIRAARTVELCNGGGQSNGKSDVGLREDSGPSGEVPHDTHPDAKMRVARTIALVSHRSVSCCGERQLSKSKAMRPRQAAIASIQSPDGRTSVIAKGPYDLGTG